MVAYDIDTAAALDAVRKTEAELTALATVPAELQRSVDTVETALGSSRVARSFTAFGTGELLPDLRSILSRAQDAVQGAAQAVAEYLRADDEMRARAEAAAAAVPDSSGNGTGSALPSAALPILPSARPAPLPKPGSAGSGPARSLPAPLPRPLPPPQKPEPDPEPGTLVPLPGPPPWRPEWLFRPALPGRPPIIVARDLMLRLYYPCPGGWHPHPGCFGPRWPFYPPGGRGPAYPPGGWIPGWPFYPPGWPFYPPGWPFYPPGGRVPGWPVLPPGWRGPAYPPGWPGPAYPPGGRVPGWPVFPPRWPEPGLPPQGRSPWWPARPLPGVLPNPLLIVPPQPDLVWPLETKQLPVPVAVGEPQGASGNNSSGKWGLT